MNIDVLRGRWEKVAALAAAVIGVVMIVVGWIGVSGSSLTTEQLPYLASGGIGGLFALGAAATLWLSGDLRDEYRALEDIYALMQGEVETEPPALSEEEEAQPLPAVPARRRRARRRLVGSTIVTAARRMLLDPRRLEREAAANIGPWTPDHLAGVLVANGVGIVLVFSGWWASSGTGSQHQALSGLDISVLGLVIAGGANAWWLARGRRVVSLARAVVLPSGVRPTAYAASALTPVAHNGNGHAPVRAAGTRHNGASAEALVAGARMSRYHRVSCPLVAGKQVKVAGRAAHERAGFVACEVCEP